MNARRLPGVRCSTLNTECRSLLCLMIMPGRSWVAGIAIAGNSPYEFMAVRQSAEAGSRSSAARGPKHLFYTVRRGIGTARVRCILVADACKRLECYRLEAAAYC